VRILILLLVLPILLLLCVLTVYWMPLPAALSGSREQVAAAAAGLLGAGYLACLLSYLLLSLHRASRALDTTLLPLGLAARREFPMGRRYSGKIAGRDVEVLYRPAYALQAARLDVEVAAQLDLRLAATAGLQRPLLDRRNCPRIDTLGLPGIQVYAADEERARAWLAPSETQSILIFLLEGPSTRELYVQPGRIWFCARLRTPANHTAAWLDDLLPALSALAEACQSASSGG
jgi:hypothetical protein